MAEVSSDFIPTSYVLNNQRRDGFITQPTHQCGRCDRQCETSERKGLSTCSYGVDFYRLSKDLLLFGFLIKSGSNSLAHTKARRQNPQSLISKDLIDKTARIMETQQNLLQSSQADALATLTEQYRQEEMYKPALLALLKPELQKSLSFLHDYRQFVARVRQNINVVLQARFPGETVELQLQKASKSEAAIYWSAVLMEDKLKTLLLLTRPEQLENAQTSTFRLHGFVLKHLRIYQAAFDEKEVRVLQSGFSSGEINASQSFAVIPQALLDNALKYSQSGCQVVLDFKETPERIVFSVTSNGPKIDAPEMQSIFEPFKRGRAGIVHEEEGSGVGLYLAQLVAKSLGTKIGVTQSAFNDRCGYLTTFSVAFRRS